MGRRPPSGRRKSWWSHRAGTRRLRADCFLGRGREQLLEPEGVRRGAVPLVMFQPFPPFRDSRNVAGRNPPQAVDWLAQLLEPLRPLLENFEMRRGVSELAQRLHGFPNRHIQYHRRILVVIQNVGSIPRCRLQPPDEPRRTVRQRVDGPQLRAETGDPRIVDRSDQTADVDLSKMAGHSSILRNNRPGFGESKGRRRLASTTARRARPAITITRAAGGATAEPRGGS